MNVNCLFCGKRISVSLEAFFDRRGVFTCARCGATIEIDPGLSGRGWRGSPGEGQEEPSAA